MDWDSYYERYSDWAERTQINNISSLKNFGASDEIVEVVQSLYNGKAATRLIQKALCEDVEFTAQEIVELVDCLDTVPEDLILSCKNRFTREQLDELLDAGVDEQLLRIAAKRSGVAFSPDPDEEEDEYEEEEAPEEPEEWEAAPARREPKIGFFTALFGLNALFGKKPHVRNGRCNGNCANCPAHYGYRYGRWYYGHHHTDGCEFGGNSRKGGTP